MPIYLRIPNITVCPTLMYLNKTRMFLLRLVVKVVSSFLGILFILFKGSMFKLRRAVLLLYSMASYAIWLFDVFEFFNKKLTKFPSIGVYIRKHNRLYRRFKNGFRSFTVFNVYSNRKESESEFFVPYSWAVARKKSKGRSSFVRKTFTNWLRYVDFIVAITWDPTDRRWIGGFRLMTSRFFYFPLFINSIKGSLTKRFMLVLSPHLISLCNLVSRTKSYLNIRSCTIIVFFFIFATMFSWLFYNLNTVPAIWLITNMAVVMPVVILWQTFMFFYKTHSLCKYTTQNQRFWKRSLTLFWLIEGFLFVIVIFIWFISPDNLNFGINHQGIISNQYFDTILFITTMTNMVLILILIRFLLYSKSTGNNLLYSILSYFLVLLVASSLFTEFNQLVNMFSRTNCIQPGSGLSNTLGIASESRLLLLDRRESIVHNQLGFLIIFLKFWHVLFISIYIIFNMLRSFNGNKLGFEAISSIYLNCTYLFLFNLTCIVFFSKYNFYFIIESPNYHYFITNPMGAVYYLVTNCFFITKSAVYQLFAYIIGVFA